jgi:hypothetical protein
MSTLGYGAYKKYFKTATTTTIKSAGSFLIDLKTLNKTPIAIGEVVQVLTVSDPIKYLAKPPASGGYISEQATMRLPVSYKNKNYLIDVNSLTKPNENTSVIDYGLQSAKLLAHATGNMKILPSLMGEENVAVAEFKKASDLAAVMLTSVKANAQLKRSPNFKKNIEDYLKSGKYTSITWYASVQSLEKKQFAKYMGELVIGLCLLNGNRSVLTGSHPFGNSKVKRFIVPMSESFKGADSAFELDNGEIIPVSSKSAGGAAAGFFGNILSPLMEKPKLLGAGVSKSAWISLLYNTARELGFNSAADINNTSKGASLRIIYELGIRHILKLDKKQVPDTYAIYVTFKETDDNSKYTKEAQLVYTKLEAAMKADGNQVALRNLDSSTTVWFCKKISDAMDQDLASMQIIKKVLGVKNYYQANLDLNNLEKTGLIKFNMINSGEANVKLKGDKSAYNVINAKSGTIAFTLKYK